MELLEKAGIDSMFLKIAGVCFLLVGICEIVTGFLAAKNSNRVDKSKFTVKIVVALLIVEIIMEIYLYFAGLMNLGFLFTAILLPLFMLWELQDYAKLQRQNRNVFMQLNPAKNKPKQQAAAAPKKSIRERAAMQARVDENNVKPEDQK